MYRSDSTISREFLTGSASERVFSTSGRALGDIELGARYQFNEGGVNKPYLIGSLRFKTRTGKDPFDVVTDCVTRCVGNTTGTGLPLDLPTGSGFYSLQPGLTWLFPSDPAVFFGGVSYTYNFKRTGVSRLVLNGEREFIGDVEPGGIFGVNFGMGLALNDRSSFSMGVDLNSVGRTRQNGVPLASSVRTQLASLLLGYSYRYSDKTA
ncbi:MAG: acetate kinase, partial [Polaromonas sp. 28-63-22]